MQKRIEEYRLKIKNGKKSKLTVVKGLFNIKIENNIIYIKQNKQWIEVSLSKLEYEYIFTQIRHHKNLLGKYKHRFDNLKHKLEKLQTLKRIVFGTKHYMKEYSNQKHSKLDYLKNKYKSYEISGRCDFKYGNMMIVPLYNSETNTFEFKLTLLNDVVIYLKNIKFPYRQDKLIEAIYFNRNKNNKKCKKNGIPISCKITRHYDEYNRCYYQIGVVFDIETINPNINYDKSSGIVALDFNLGHIDMTELDSNGNLVYFKTFKYTLSNKAYINKKSLYNILDEVGKYAKRHHKVLAIEELDLQELKTKFNSDRKHQKSLNRYLHSLPYNRYAAKVQYLKIKYELDVITVKPNFTSIIGELKYANSMKLNSHISASYVIGRRALGLVDYPLDYQYKQLMTIQPIKLYKSNWSMWSTLNKIKTT